MIFQIPLFLPLSPTIIAHISLNNTHLRRLEKYKTDMSLSEREIQNLGPDYLQSIMDGIKCEINRKEIMYCKKHPQYAADLIGKVRRPICSRRPKDTHALVGCEYNIQSDPDLVTKNLFPEDVTKSGSDCSSTIQSLR